jgi:hypothetical protein
MLEVNPFTINSSSLSDGTNPQPPAVADNFGLFNLVLGTPPLLPFNATATQVKAALENLDPTALISPTDLLVTGGPLGVNPIDIQWIGRYAGRDMKTLPVTFSNVSDGTTALPPTVTVQTASIVSIRKRLEELINISVAERGEITTSHLPQDIIVTGGPLPAAPVRIEFVGQHTSNDVPLLLVNDVAATASDDTGTSEFTFAPPTSGVKIATAVIQSSAIIARPAARLAIDPGIIVKLEGAKIEAETGSSQFIAEGTTQRPIIFTTRKDDRFGASGTFDTTGDGTPADTQSLVGDWGGLIFNAGSSASIDHAIITFGGGRIPIEGDLNQFNAIEVHQADFRLTNSVLEENASGLASSTRNGRGMNSEAVVFVRGAQPIIVDNIFRNNTVHDNTHTPSRTPTGTSMISINANALNSGVQSDYGRTTGRLELVLDVATGAPAFTDNRGPLIRRNLVENNDVNGLEVRGEELTTATVWDDTDIVHVLRDEIVVMNHHTLSGLRLQSSPTESLVVKLGGNPNDSTNLNGLRTGFTAGGTPLDIDDRIGGTVQVIGQPGFPVILTSLSDDGEGASSTVNGLPHTDTNNDGAATTPQPGDWRGIRLEKYSNDRNVVVVNEVEGPFTNGHDINFTPMIAELLGELAPNEKSGDETRALGYTVNGFIAVDDPTDVDVFSFKAQPGTEVWLDIDGTNSSLDAIVELVAQNGGLLARSIDNGNRTSTPTVVARDMTRDARLGGDFYSTNPKDPGMRVVLPGTGTGLVTYFVRVRSNTATTPGAISNVFGGGLTRGAYQLQVRLRQEDEKGGSNIRFANILYPETGIDVQGLPGHSPLTGESAEDTTQNNDARTGAQYLGNLLTTDLNTISVGGSLSSADDVDWYRFDLTYEQIQAIQGVNNSGKSLATIFDIDYADQLSRPDAVLAIYDRGGNLILTSRDSDIVDDQPQVGQGNDFDDLSRGSLGKLDPYIGRGDRDVLRGRDVESASGCSFGSILPSEYRYTGRSS